MFEDVDEEYVNKLRHEMCEHLLNDEITADQFIKLPKGFQVAILKVMFERV